MEDGGGVLISGNIDFLFSSTWRVYGGLCYSVEAGDGNSGAVV